MYSIWKAEQQQSGYYNLVSWKIKNMCLRKLILNQAGFPDVTTDELKKIVFLPLHRRKCSRLCDQSGSVNTLQFPIRRSRRRKKLKKPNKVTADVSDSIFQEFDIVIPIASHKYPSVEWLHACYQKYLFCTFKDLFTSFNVFNSFHWLKDHCFIIICIHISTKYI